MEYYQKYLKYKTKYMSLKKSIKIKQMYGGDKPMVEILKDINLFPIDSKIESYLNPIYGFLLNETGFIKNYQNLRKIYKIRLQF